MTAKRFLPVRPHLRPKPWRLQLPPDHPEAHALLWDRTGLFCSPPLPVELRIMPLDVALELSVGGQA
jgi:hypothetical protein